MNNRHTVFATVLAGLLLGACGQKGPLFLPGEQRDVQTGLPELSREALEQATREDDDEDAQVVPDTERPEAEDDEAEPFVDPASPPAETDDH